LLHDSESERAASTRGALGTPSQYAIGHERSVQIGPRRPLRAGDSKDDQVGSAGGSEHHIAVHSEGRRHVRPIQPVHLDDSGAKVHNLHSALLFLILHLSISDNDLSILRRRLAPEMRDETFGKATSDLVQIWQDQMKHRLDVPKVLTNLVHDNGD